MQPEAPIPAKHCTQAAPIVPTQTTPQATSAPAQAICLPRLQPDGSMAPASWTRLAPRETAGAWTGIIMTFLLLRSNGMARTLTLSLTRAWSRPGPFRR
jgi:hypothetical protein